MGVRIGDGSTGAGEETRDHWLEGWTRAAAGQVVGTMTGRLARLGWRLGEQV